MAKWAGLIAHLAFYDSVFCKFWPKNLGFLKIWPNLTSAFQVYYMNLLRKAEYHKAEFSKGRIQKAEKLIRPPNTRFSAIFPHLDNNWAT